MTIDIKDLISEGEEIEWKGTKFRIAPLTVKQQAKFAQLQAEKKYGDASYFLFAVSVKKAFPNWTDEDLEKISDADFTNKVMEAVQRVNKLEFKNAQNFQQKIPEKP